MKSIIAFTVVLLSFAFGTLNAQKDTTVEYLDSSLHNVSKQKSIYCRVSVRQNKMYIVAMVRMQDGSKVYTGSFTDRSLTGAEGLFQYYTKNMVTMRGYYHEGRQIGTWKKWGIDSLLMDSVAFDDNGNVVAEAKYSYHLNRKLWRYVMENDLDQRISAEYDTTGALVSQGKFTGNDGETFFYYQGGKPKAHAVFKNNQRVVYDFFDEEGKKYTEQEFSQLPKHK